MLDSFGPERLTFGSDWRVCLVATAYREQFSLVAEQSEGLSNAERDAILGRTPMRACSLDL